MNDDGHSPKTCNYTRCDSESDVPCPFLKGSDSFKPNSTSLGMSQRLSDEFVEKLKADAHDHRYTVPVEWIEVKVLDAESLKAKANGFSVSKLRCETCESEVERA